jgi:hypothetical protein
VVASGAEQSGQPIYTPLEIRRWMRLAVDRGRQSVSEGDPTKPYVGAVVVQKGKVVGTGYRGMVGAGNHAEYGVLPVWSVVFSLLNPRYPTPDPVGEPT